MFVKLTKLTELPDALNPNNIPEGFTKTVEYNNNDQFYPPEVGYRFWLGRSFSTSGVIEIIDEHTFKTYSSIYHWETSETPFV